MSDARPKSKGFERDTAAHCTALGDAHAEHEDDRNDFDEDFHSFVVEGAWDFVWSEPGLSQRDRSMITIAILATLGHYEEIQAYIRATQNSGVTAADIKEALLHVAIYAGVPTANHAIKIIKKTYVEMESDATSKA